MFLWNWLKDFIAPANTGDMSRHRAHTTKYEDLCM
jgi:hypothetical protein